MKTRKNLNRSLNAYATLVAYDKEVKEGLFPSHTLIEVFDKDTQNYILVTPREYNDMMERRC